MNLHSNDLDRKRAVTLYSTRTFCKLFCTGVGNTVHGAEVCGGTDSAELCKSQKLSHIVTCPRLRQGSQRGLELTRFELKVKLHL